jgi:hypothetical protein
MGWIEDQEEHVAHGRALPEQLRFALAMLREAVALLAPQFMCRAHPEAPCGCRDVRRRRLIEAVEKGPGR